MEKLLLTTLFCTLLQSALGAEGLFNYTAQEAWPGDCNIGSRQSPVNIVTANVQSNSSLGMLQFSNTWDTASNGTFENTAQTVKFTPDSTDITTELSGLGTYRFLQVHFHWGPNSTRVGSEHTVDSQASELEIHFVHQRVATTGPMGESFGVVGVFADVSSDAISGPWATLNASMVPNNQDSIPITGFTLSSLLPTNRNPYYHYAGSLTTPNCDEVVQWYVLQERVTVPEAYLQQLRQINGPTSTPITMNYRDTQPLNGRTIWTPGSDAIIASASLIAVLSLALLASMFIY